MNIDMKNPILAALMIILCLYLTHSAVFFEEVWQIVFSLFGAAVSLWTALIFSRPKDKDDDDNDDSTES